jgi:hypothetical protein
MCGASRFVLGLLGLIGGGVMFLLSIVYAGKVISEIEEEE